MANRHELYRKQTIQQRSPLRSHSMNQESASRFFDGEQKFRQPKKIERSERRRELHTMRQRAASVPFHETMYQEGVRLLRSGEASFFHGAYVETHLQTASHEAAQIVIFPSEKAA